jgi:hypothetical protein
MATATAQAHSAATLLLQATHHLFAYSSAAPAAYATMAAAVRGDKSTRPAKQLANLACALRGCAWGSVHAQRASEMLAALAVPQMTLLFSQPDEVCVLLQELAHSDDEEYCDVVMAQLVDCARF